MKIYNNQIPNHNKQIINNNQAPITKKAMMDKMVLFLFGDCNLVIDLLEVGYAQKD